MGEIHAGTTSGVRVLDLSQFLAGPYGTQILGDLGAQVIKVEQPGVGDGSRGIPPHFSHGFSGYFLAVNRNKKSITLDLKQTQGHLKRECTMLGTLLNTATVIVGGTAGTFLRARFSERVRRMVMWGVGLVSLVIGLQMSLSTGNILIVLGSLLGGGIVGELAHMHEGLNALGELLQAKIKAEAESTFSKGFVTASLLFCVGPMTILGSIQDGLSGDYRLLATKAMLDGVSAVALAASLGWGVLAAALTVLLYQGGLTLGAGLVKTALTEPMLAEMTATGGTLILAIGLNLLDVTAIRVANFLPALLIAPAIVALLQVL
ncbi:MAG: DUF554 family protein [Nitrospinae bacterium]|nr:DUF554 family protein [Nitrospinota bacterium]